MIDPQTPIDPTTLDHNAIFARFRRPVVITQEDAADMMGVSPRTVFRMIHDGQIPAACREPWGERIRIKREPFLEWLDAWQMGQAA